jgi:hypothetical protein
MGLHEILTEATWEQTLEARVTDADGGGDDRPSHAVGLGLAKVSDQSIMTLDICEHLPLLVAVTGCQRINRSGYYQR